MSKHHLAQFLYKKGTGSGKVVCSPIAAWCNLDHESEDVGRCRKMSEGTLAEFASHFQVLSQCWHWFRKVWKVSGGFYTSLWIEGQGLLQFYFKIEGLLWEAFSRGFQQRLSAEAFSRGFQYLGAPFSLHFLRPVMAHPGAPPLPRCAPWRVPAAGSEDCRPPRIVDCPRPPRFGTRPKAHDARPAAWPRRCCRCQVVPSTSRHKKSLKIIRNPRILCKQRMAKD